MTHVRIITAGLLGGLLLVAGTARAQGQAPMAPQIAFAEVNGGYGIQLGDIDYLPGSEGPADWKYPIIHGPAVGGTVGVMLIENLALFVNYEYTWATTQTVSIEGAVDELQATLDYHTLVAGLRTYVPVGFGRIRAELGFGFLFPFNTRVELQYNQALAALPEPITGIGEQIENFSPGFGGTAALGYELPIVPGLYLAFNLKYKLFQSENSGETTELRNFVTDFSATPLTAVDETILHGDGAARPRDSAVHDVRFQLSLGAGF